MHFSKPRPQIAIEFRKSSAEGPITTKDYVFPKKEAAFVKTFLRTRRMQFWQPLRKMFDEVLYFFDCCPRWWKNETFEQIFFRRIKIFEHVVWNCNKPTKIPDKLLKPFRWKSQIEWKTLRFLHQKIFLMKMTLWRGRMQFLQPRRKNFNIKSKKITQYTKMIRNYSIFQKKILEVFLWAQRKQFSQPRRQSSDKTQKHSTQNLKKSIISSVFRKNYHS